MLSKNEIIKILESKSKDVFFEADKIREQYVGNDIHLRALIEFSNICMRTCKYCGLRCYNKDIDRYRIKKEEIINCAQTAVDLGYKTIVLQSGEDKFYTEDYMCEIISEIKKFNVALTLSIGEKSYEEYKRFKEAGADRYLLRIETTDKLLYSKLHPKMSFENRVKCLENLKELGYEVGTGCLVGLPNQTISSLADDIMFFNSIEADMVGIGPFISHPQTPLRNKPNGDFTLALKVMALTRITMKDINIPATTAMETLKPNGQILALQSGANVIMPNVTYENYRKNYEIYPNKKGFLQNSKTYIKDIEEKFKPLNRTISNNYGFHKKHLI